MLLEKSPKKIQRWDPKPVLMEIGEGHRFPESRVGDHLAGGGPPFGAHLRWEKIIIDKPW